MDLRYTGLSPEPFRSLFAMSNAELAARSVVRIVVDASPGFPDRISMTEIAVGRTALLVNHCSLDLDTPYRATHAIYVGEIDGARYDAVNEVPEVMRHRLLSLRAFDERGMMLDADVADGRDVDRVARRFLANPASAFVHVHNARQGCYSGRIDRA